MPVRRNAKRVFGGDSERIRKYNAKRRRVTGKTLDGKPTFLNRKRATASALRKKKYDPSKFIDRSRPLVESCFFCSNRSGEGKGSFVCASCLAKFTTEMDTPLGLAVWGIKTGIDYWFDGNWFLTGMLVDKYARKPTRRWKW